MDFAIKVEPCQHCTPLNCSGKTCYFGTCGMDGECQCLSGYSGDDCSTSKLNYESCVLVFVPLDSWPDFFSRLFLLNIIFPVLSDTFQDLLIPVVILQSSTR